MLMIDKGSVEGCKNLMVGCMRTMKAWVPGDANPHSIAKCRSRPGRAWASAQSSPRLRRCARPPPGGAASPAPPGTARPAHRGPKGRAGGRTSRKILHSFAVFITESYKHYKLLASKFTSILRVRHSSLVKNLEYIRAKNWLL